MTAGRQAILVLAALSVVLVSSAPAQAPGRSGPYRLTARVVDSVRSVDEELRRFRADIPVAPTRLSGGAPSRAMLVRRFVAALVGSDTASLVRMALTRAEFAYLTYPSSPFTRPPYRQSPEIVWLLLGVEHDKGLTRLMRRLAGQELTYLGHRCDAKPQREGRNRIWRGCVTRVRLATGTVLEKRLFGAIVERDGQFKFASYATDF